MFLEYEAACSRPEHVQAAGFDERQLRVFFDALAWLMGPVVSHFVWRPQLRDPNDEMVLEAAVNGQADAIVTFNACDFGDAPARFGLKTWLPRDAVRKVSP